MIFSEIGADILKEWATALGSMPLHLTGDLERNVHSILKKGSRGVKLTLAQMSLLTNIAQHNASTEQLDPYIRLEGTILLNIIKKAYQVDDIAGTIAISHKPSK